MYGALARGYIQLIGVDESAYLKWSLPATVKDMRALRAILPSVLAPSPARGRADLVTTTSLTGHARIATTQIYTQPGDADRIKAKRGWNSRKLHEVGGQVKHVLARWTANV